METLGCVHQPEGMDLIHQLTTQFACILVITYGSLFRFSVYIKYLLR